MKQAIESISTFNEVIVIYLTKQCYL